MNHLWSVPLLQGPQYALTVDDLLSSTTKEVVVGRWWNIKGQKPSTSLEQEKITMIRMMKKTILIKILMELMAKPAILIMRQVATRCYFIVAYMLSLSNSSNLYACFFSLARQVLHALKDRYMQMCCRGIMLHTTCSFTCIIGHEEATRIAFFIFY